MKQIATHDIIKKYYITVYLKLKIGNPKTNNTIQQYFVIRCTYDEN